MSNVLDTLITDRVGGHYNAEDLNRVDSAVELLTELLRKQGYTAETITRPGGWEPGYSPSFPELERYLENIRALIAAYYTLPDTPELPESMRGLTYSGANAIERVLRDIAFIFYHMVPAFRFSKQFISGEYTELAALRLVTISRLCDSLGRPLSDSGGNALYIETEVVSA